MYSYIYGRCAVLIVTSYVRARVSGVQYRTTIICTGKGAGMEGYEVPQWKNGKIKPLVPKSVRKVFTIILLKCTQMVIGILRYFAPSRQEFKIKTLPVPLLSYLNRVSLVMIFWRQSSLFMIKSFNSFFLN